MSFTLSEHVKICSVEVDSSDNDVAQWSGTEEKGGDWVGNEVGLMWLGFWNLSANFFI